MNAETMNDKTRIIGCIPARYASTRLPGKPLSYIAVNAMIIHVVEKAKHATILFTLIVLTAYHR